MPALPLFSSLSSSPCHDCGADTVAAVAVVLGRSGRVQYSLIGRSVGRESPASRNDMRRVTRWRFLHRLAWTCRCKMHRAGGIMVAIG